MIIIFSSNCVCKEKWHPHTDHLKGTLYPCLFWQAPPFTIFSPLPILRLFYFNLSCYSSPEGLRNVKNPVPQKRIGRLVMMTLIFLCTIGWCKGRQVKRARFLPPPSGTAALQDRLYSTAMELVKGREEEESQSHLLLAGLLHLGTGRSPGWSSSSCLESVGALFLIISLNAGTESLVSCRLVFCDWLKRA